MKRIHDLSDLAHLRFTASSTPKAILPQRGAPSKLVRIKLVMLHNVTSTNKPNHRSTNQVRHSHAGDAAHADLNKEAKSCNLFCNSDDSSSAVLVFNMHKRARHENFVYPPLCICATRLFPTWASRGSDVKISSIARRQS
eukprot:TRINITY_DN76760_c0_g1_i1.p1 TRINITY_DN76760_c0_g1~~TRINITY_DN76760_c0_g1_i1.p1  ORF type:complete len:140 (-),score=8.39 TRINITY_DN76760_c0_g1_i1:47-466(-)